MIHRLIRFLLYRSWLAGLLYPIVYRKWLKRYRRQEGFLSGERLHAWLPASEILTYHPPEQVHFQRPAFAEDPLPRQIDFYVGKTFTVSAGEVYRFQNAWLVGENAVGLTHDGQIILDTVMDLPNVLPKCSPRLLMNYQKLRTNIAFDRVVSLVHIFCNAHYVNYFHWISDSLLLLEGWRAFEERYGEVKILINDHPKRFQMEFLELLGVAPSRLIYWSSYQKAAVRELIVVKSRRTGTNMDEIVSPQGVRWLRYEVSKRVRPAKRFGERIFLTRQKTGSRRILNFEEVLAVTSRHGFEEVEADGLSVADQVGLFANMKVLCAVHGAGLTNMIFAENLRIMELFGNVDTPGDFQWYCAYYSMSQALGHTYTFLECEAFPILKMKGMKQIYDIKVDTSRLDNLLARLVSEEQSNE